MSQPRSLSEKLTKYATDNFDVWLRKTNITVRETGDLHKLKTDILTRLLNEQVSVNNCNHTVDAVGRLELNKFTYTGISAFVVDDEILVGVQFRSVKTVAEPTPGTFVITVDAPFNPQLNNSTIINATTVSLVGAINEAYNESRRTLIKAIAMS